MDPTQSNHQTAYQPRNRRNCYGELVQIDGSLHHWFEERAPKCYLLVYIDDATSSLMNLYFVPSESMHTYFLATKQYLQKHGKPTAFYSDKLSVFRVNGNCSREDLITQFCRGLHELNIDLIYANSPQAKGRVERTNKTLQDRLVKELRLKGISDIESANNFMPEFMSDHNRRFAKSPISDFNAHRELQPYENIDKALCFKQERTVTNNLTIQHDRILYLIENNIQNRLLKRQKIDLFEYPDGNIELFHKGKYLKFSKIYDRVLHEVQENITPNKRIEQTLEILKNIQQFRGIKRSTRAPTKRHLGIIPPRERSKKQKQT